MSLRTLGALALLAAAAAAVQASSDSSPALVIVGTREPEAIDRLAADVVRLDEARIRDSAADSLADLLRREAGLQLSRNGGPGQSAGLFLRGAGSGQTVLLVDGVRVGSATLGWPNFDAVPLAAIERIEVLRGPGSSLYGADAVGGVVRVFTRRSAPGLQFSAQALAGGYGAREAALTVGGATGAWDHLVTVSQEGNDGVSALRAGDRFGNYNPDADGYRQRSAQATVGYAPARGHRIGLTLLSTRAESDYDASEYLPPSYSQDATPDFRNRGTSRLAALDWRGEISSRLTGSAQVSRSIDDLLSGASAPERYRTQREQFGAQLAWRPSAAQQWVLAAEAMDEQVHSTAYLADERRRSQAVVLAWSGAWRGLSGQADLRTDHSAAHGSVTTGRAGASWAVAPGLRMRVLAGTTFRAPGFNDLYYPGYGVSTLAPERGRSVEAGLTWRAGTNEASATVFRNRVRELIGYEPDAALCPDDPSYAYGCARNVDRATLQGVTLAGSRRIGSLALRAQFDGLDAHDERTGQRLPRRAAHQAMLGAEQALGAWRWSAQVLRVGARPDGGVTLPAETTLDLLASWRFAPRWQLLARLLNATDADLQPARDYRGLGRQAWLGLRYEGSR